MTTNEDEEVSNEDVGCRAPLGTCTCGAALIPWLEGESEIGLKCSGCDWSWMDYYA